MDQKMRHLSALTAVIALGLSDGGLPGRHRGHGHGDKDIRAARKRQRQARKRNRK